ncbi:hypothetical protein N9E48_01715 [Paracoccaceae bacterium]|nr:hypothetical protein [Paracoccaceae bacterium]
MKIADDQDISSHIPERFHGLDFLGSIAMLMGLVFHSPMPHYITIMADGFQELVSPARLGHQWKFG